MPFGPMAYYEGQNLPRCTATPTEADEQEQPWMAKGLAHGTWECALPEGHADFDNPRVHPHSWAQTGD